MQLVCPAGSLPALKAAVDWGYPDNDPLARPGAVERAGVLPSRAENARFARDFRDGVRAGVRTLRPADDDGATSRTARKSLRSSELVQRRDAGPTTTLRKDPPRPRALSAPRAVQRIAKALTPKTRHRTAPGRSD